MKQVKQSSFIDTHEHLLEEEDRLKGEPARIKSNDWSLVLSHYLDSDLLTAGMPRETYAEFFSPSVDPLKKWDLIEPYWPRVRNTGYGQAVEIAMRELYAVPSLGRDSIARIQAGYQKRIHPGFYREILREVAGIESGKAILPQRISPVGRHGADAGWIALLGPDPRAIGRRQRSRYRIGLRLSGWCPSQSCMGNVCIDRPPVHCGHAGS